VRGDGRGAGKASPRTLTSPAPRSTRPGSACFPHMAYGRIQHRPPTSSDTPGSRLRSGRRSPPTAPTDIPRCMTRDPLRPTPPRARRRLGAPALRLVRPAPHRHHDHRLQPVGWPLGPRLSFTRQPDERTSVDATVIREGINLKGRRHAILLSTRGKRVLGSALAKTVEAVEARNYRPRQAES
jgi:hypothetical protein